MGAPEYETFVIKASTYFLIHELPHNFYEIEEDELMREIHETVMDEYSHFTNEKIYTDILYIAELLQEAWLEGYDAGMEALNS